MLPSRRRHFFGDTLGLVIPLKPTAGLNGPPSGREGFEEGLVEHTQQGVRMGSMGPRALVNRIYVIGRRRWEKPSDHEGNRVMLIER